MIVSQPGVFVPAELCGRLAHVLEQELARLRRDSVTIRPEVERLAAELGAFDSCSDVGTRDVPLVDVEHSVPGPSLTMTTTEAGDELGIGERAVVGQIHRGSLIAEKVGNAYRVDAASVRARAERLGRA